MITRLPPAVGPVYLSIPMDDWKRPLSGFTRVRTLSDRVAPDTEWLRGFAERISASRRPALVFGPEVDRAGGGIRRHDGRTAERPRTGCLDPGPRQAPVEPDRVARGRRRPDIALTSRRSALGAW